MSLGAASGSAPSGAIDLLSSNRIETGLPVDATASRFCIGPIIGLGRAVYEPADSELTAKLSVSQSRINR
jgi:hypothetical protein